MHIYIISGTSGSGKSVVIRALEDAGFNCIDNLPVNLLENLIQGLDPINNNLVAVAIDGRQGDSIHNLPSIIAKLKANYEITVLFLDASTTTLVNRFSETRRRHPLSIKANNQSEYSLIESINFERELLSSINNIGHHIDTTNLSSNTLRNWVKDLVQENVQGLTLLFESFGYKHGIPQDIDLIFDMRCIPNPYYENALRHLTGNDDPVKEFLNIQAEFKDLKKDIYDFLCRWIPKYQIDGRSYLTIGIGCTGGQHRSVAMVNDLHQACLKSSEKMFQSMTILKRHRELNRHSQVVSQEHK
ncbi:nucleotide-binding protein [Polynucleobacter sp. SHI8]|uniref:RNase adapter RapZ n=1 Tax=unclassified Polynucleobacter TaxID=2640945 RepID=UPI002493085D|nr:MULTISPECIES: RNase adapter RapZ [unclassified Polynucleobacter]BDW12125.1 nucleotide-binding protein [Polynucleobacter sp. SHI2]BDW14573.1 nucleotide-binding protein [Polynucleobacter sp. SHI8]